MEEKSELTDLGGVLFRIAIVALADLQKEGMFSQDLQEEARRTRKEDARVLEHTLETLAACHPKTPGQGRRRGIESRRAGMPATAIASGCWWQPSCRVG